MDLETRAQHAHTRGPSVCHLLDRSATLLRMHGAREEFAISVAALGNGDACMENLLTAESAWVLQAHACTDQPMHHTVHSAAHEQHTHRLSASAMHNCRSPRAAIEMAKSSLLPCIISSVADLSSRWHTDGPLVCACCARVSRSIPPSHVLPSSVDECAPLLPREFPRGTERNRREFK